MAYDTKKLYETALDAIDRNNLFFLADVIAYLSIAKSTFYDHFPENSDQSNQIKERLQKNRMKTKVSIRSKLHSSNNTSGLLALYKLIATDEERRALAMEYREHSGEVQTRSWIIQKASDAAENEDK